MSLSLRLLLLTVGFFALFPPSSAAEPDHNNKRGPVDQVKRVRTDATDRIFDDLGLQHGRSGFAVFCHIREKLATNRGIFESFRCGHDGTSST